MGSFFLTVEPHKWDFDHLNGETPHSGFQPWAFDGSPHRHELVKSMGCALVEHELGGLGENIPFPTVKVYKDVIFYKT